MKFKTAIYIYITKVRGLEPRLSKYLTVYYQNIVDMIVDYALWVAVLKKEFSKIIVGRL